MKQALDLIDQLIEIEQQREREFKSWCLANHKANQTDGESKMLYHLKVLKELIQTDSKYCELNIGTYNETNWPRNGNYLFPRWWVEKKVKFIEEKHNIGKKIRIKNGSWKDRTAIIKKHFLDGDDCSGNFGDEMYKILFDDNNEFGSTPKKDCEILDL